MFNHENEKRFFKMLDLAPELKRFWDEKEGSMKPKSVTSELKLCFAFLSRSGWVIQITLILILLNALS